VVFILNRFCFTLKMKQLQLYKNKKPFHKRKVFTK